MTHLKRLAYWAGTACVALATVGLTWTVIKPLAFAAPAAEGKQVVTGDWPMWGGSPDRNMANETTGISLDFEPPLDGEKGKRVIATAKLGSQTYGNPTVAGGKVLVGTNNGGEYRPKHKGDRGVVLCFDEKTLKLLWQLTREKLPEGRVNDWPEQGICSTPIIEGNRCWLVTNRAEVMCIDMEGFHDGKNNGPYTDEADAEMEDADIIWVYDMISEMGVFPHNLATSSPVTVGDKLFIHTSNGVDEAHLSVPSPRAPSFVCLDKNTGEVVWENANPTLDSYSPEPFNTVLHGQWSSPGVGEVNGKPQIYFPGGDGWLYAFSPEGEELWRFDLNPKDSKWELGGRGTRNNIIGTPIFAENSVILAVGQDPEHGEGIGHLYRIDCTKAGDVSPVLPNGQPNPNSAQVWHYGGVDFEGTITGKKDELIFRRTISTCSVHNGLVFAADLSGFLHCLDFKTGERYWEADLLAAVWGSPLYVDGKVFIGDEDGELAVFAATKEKNHAKKQKPIAEYLFSSSIYSTPTIANGVMFVSDRSTLYAIDILGAKE